MQLLRNEMLDDERRIESEELEPVAGTSIRLSVCRVLTLVGPIRQENGRWIRAWNSREGLRSRHFKILFLRLSLRWVRVGLALSRVILSAMRRIIIIKIELDRLVLRHGLE